MFSVTFRDDGGLGCDPVDAVVPTLPGRDDILRFGDFYNGLVRVTYVERRYEADAVQVMGRASYLQCREVITIWCSPSYVSDRNRCLPNES